MRFTKLFINIGKKQNLNASGLIGLINEYSKRRNVEIGKIDIQRKFSFFEIDSNFEKELIKSLNNQVIDGVPINIGRVESNSPEAQREGGSGGGSFRREKFDSGQRGGRREGGRREGAYNDRGDRGRGRRNY
jgi:ATP-dependent RNA helicase DeaD